MRELGPATRLLACWLSGFLEWTKNLPASEILRLWAGIFTLQAAMTRKVWLPTDGGIIYPNTYIMFVGKPGTGKDKAIGAAKELLLLLNMDSNRIMNVSPTSLSAMGIVDELDEEDSAGGTYLYDPTGSGNPRSVDYRSLIVCIPELGTSLTRDHDKWVSNMNELYDCKSIFEDKVRGHAKKTIKNPHVHAILGTQPDYIGTTFKTESFGMGFFSRMIMIYERELTEIAYRDKDKPPPDDALRDKLVHDLRQITDMVGPFTMTDEAWEWADDWRSMLKEEEKPTHSKLEHYNARRVLHLPKIAMAMSASRGASKIIEKDDLVRSHSFLRKIERRMPGIFAAITSSKGHAEEMNEIEHFVVNHLKESGKPVREFELVRMLSRRVQAHQVTQIIDNMVKAKILRVKFEKLGERFFIPGDI